MSAAPDLSDAEVALILGKNVRTVQRWAANGKLPGAHKVGRAWRIPDAAVEAVAGREVERLRSGLEAAVLACEALRADVNRAASAYRRFGRTPRERDWRAVAIDLDRIEGSLSGLRAEIERYLDG